LNALHLASKEGHVNIVTELIDRGAFVDAATKVCCYMICFICLMLMMCTQYCKLNIQQAGRRLVRSLLTVCDIGVSLHPWAYVDNK